jgi:hypothetical protein
VDGGLNQLPLFRNENLKNGERILLEHPNPDDGAIAPADSLPTKAQWLRNTTESASCLRLRKAPPTETHQPRQPPRGDRSTIPF